MAKEKYGSIAIIVLGRISTDIVAYNLPRLPLSGEKIYGDNLVITSSGESCNIAKMAAALTNTNTVAMISRTSKDPYGLWKPPIEAMRAFGVNTDYIKIIPFANSKKYPSISLISIDTEGERSSSTVVGINSEFSIYDIEAALPLFETARNNNGLLALSLELPIVTALRAIETANQHNLKVILDPGGITEKNKEEILKQEIFLIKPNELETKILTGISISNIDTAEVAAEMMLQHKIKHILITHGENGAYYFTKGTKLHIQNPKIPKTTNNDPTGCGEQILSVLCAGIIQRKDLISTIKEAVVAGALQYNKVGAQPITNEELASYLH